VMEHVMTLPSLVRLAVRALIRHVRASRLRHASS
jgi:hypothetical protein